MLVIPDTNVLFADPLLERADAIAVKDAAPRVPGCSRTPL